MTNEDPEGQRSDETKDKQKDESDNSRRIMLKTSLGLSVVLALGGIGAVAKSLISPGAQPTLTTTQTASSSASQSGNLPPPSSPGFPVIKIANLKDLEVATPIIFNYPLEDQPNQLFKFGKKFKDGAGPDGDIVAYSGICQHMGCIWGFVDTGSSPKCNHGYKASSPVGYCCCHGSVYDLEDDAKVISGPAPRPLPRDILAIDSSTGDIYATGMNPPTVFGFHTGSNNVSYDLQGGTMV